MSDYLAYQSVRNEEYLKAWESASKEWKEEALRNGINGPELDSPVSCSMEVNENHESVSQSWDPCELDTMIDDLLERFGPSHYQAIMESIKRTKQAVEREMQKEKAIAIARAIMYFVSSETKNIRAALHGALHAIPGMAAANGFSSMRSSAAHCGVSVEWIRRCRNDVCEALELPIPKESSKSEESCRKYSENAQKNHWRRQNRTLRKTCKKTKSPLLQEIQQRLASRRVALRLGQTLLTKNGDTV